MYLCIHFPGIWGANINLSRTHLQARHKLKPLDKLIGATEKLAMGERASNPYVVISVGESCLARFLLLSNTSSAIISDDPL